jgi:hypothetical protein
VFMALPRDRVAAAQVKDFDGALLIEGKGEVMAPGLEAFIFDDNFSAGSLHVFHR